MKFKKRKKKKDISSGFSNFQFLYNPINTAFHRLSPISKIIWLIALTIIVLIERSIILLSIIFVIIVIQAKLVKIGIWQTIKRLKWFLLFTVLMIPLNSIFNAPINLNDEILFYLYKPYFPIRHLAVYYTLKTSLMIFILLTSTMIFLNSTTHRDIIYGFIKLGIPYPLGFSLAVGLRYIPLIKDDTNIVRLAQKARGLDRENVKSFKKSIELIKDRIITTLLIILKRSETTATSMELRGFGKMKKRTWYKKFRLTLKDKMFIVFIILFLLLYVLYTFDLLPIIPDIPSLYMIFF